MDFGFFTNQQLFDLFCRNKTKISTIKDPQMLLRHLKDNKIISGAHEKAYDPENSDESVYRVLNFIEERGQKCVRRFWECVNKEHILARYPQICELTLTLTNELPESTHGSRVLSEDRSTRAEAREARGSTSFTEMQSNSPHFMNTNLWDLPEHEKLLPVRCGEIEGLLHRDKLYNKERECIEIEGQLITPYQFEEMGGRQSTKNWKMSIQCHDTPLKILIERNILKVPQHDGRFVLRK